MNGISFKTLGKYAGIGGIAIGAVIFIFSTFLRRSIFPSLSTDQAYNILKLLLLLTFAIGVIGVAVWAHAKKASATIIVAIFAFAGLIAYMSNQRLEFAATQEKQKTDVPPEEHSTPTPSPAATPSSKVDGSSSPTATPFPTITPSPSPSPTASPLKSEVIYVAPGDTGMALDGQVSVSLIGVSFEGSPLRDRATFRVSTPAGSRSFEKRDVGEIVAFPGYEIRLTSVASYRAGFQVQRMPSKLQKLGTPTTHRSKAIQK